MECSTPGVIRDEELLAYMAGEKVRPVVAAHLARCQRCSMWVAEYRGLERSLIQKFYRRGRSPVAKTYGYHRWEREGGGWRGRGRDLTNNDVCQGLAATS